MIDRILLLLDRSRRPMRGPRGLATVAVASAVCYLAVVLTAQGGTAYDSQVLMNAMINVMLVMSLFLIFGMSGQISVGHAAFFGLGAYGAGYLATAHDLAFPATLVIGGATGAVAGLLLTPLSRLDVHYFVMTTLGLGLVLYHVFGTFRSVTGGWSGLSGVPGFGTVGGLDLNGTAASASIVFACLLLEFYFLRTLVVTRPGRVFRGVRDDNLAAASLGLKVTWVKAEAAVMGCGFAGVAGALSSHVNGFLSPESYGLVPSTYLVLAVVLGGTGSLLGAVLAGLAMPYVSEALTAWADVSPVVFGGLIVLVMLFAPSGLAGLWQWLVDAVVPSRLRAPTEAPAKPDGERDRRETIERLRPYFDASSSKRGDLVAKGVEKRFGGVVAVRHVDLDITAGEIHGIIGPNGAGKSSLYNVLTGVTPPDSGAVTFAGNDVTRARPQQCAATGIVRTFQNGRLFNTMSVYENVLTAVGPNPGLPSLHLLIRPVQAARQERHAADVARWLVALVGLEEHADTNVEELAYGQRRLVEIARALAARPRILLLDEPAAGLAVGDRKSLTGLLRTLQSELGMSIGIVEHDLDLIGAVCDRVTVLHEGRNIATDTPHEVLRDPEVRAAYMGRAASDEAVPVALEKGGTA